MTCCYLGVVRFHEVAVGDIEAECGQETGSEEVLTTAGSLLEHYIQSVRDSLGVELHTATMSK
jgi:hypothetical protein